MKKRILSILLTLCMVLCLVPTAAFAADGTEAIQPGASAQSILKIDRSRLSFAGHEWWVIGKKTDESNNAPIITLLAVNNDFGDVPFRTGSAVPFENARRYSEDNSYYANNPSNMSQWRKPNEYAGSTLQQKMVSLAEAIPEKEQAVIRPKDITEGITGQEVKAQKLWTLSHEDSMFLYRNSSRTLHSGGRVLPMRFTATDRGRFIPMAEAAAPSTWTTMLPCGLPWSWICPPFSLYLLPSTEKLQI